MKDLIKLLESLNIPYAIGCINNNSKEVTNEFKDMVTECNKRCKQDYNNYKNNTNKDSIIKNYAISFLNANRVNSIEEDEIKLAESYIASLKIYDYMISHINEALINKLNRIIDLANNKVKAKKAKKLKKLAEAEREKAYQKELDDVTRREELDKLPKEELINLLMKNK